MTWNHDIAKAPRGKIRLVPTGKGNATRKLAERAEIIAAGRCGTVTVSYWIDAEKRWNLFTVENAPIAWMPYAGPREYLDAKGKTRYAADLPAHPTMSESWFSTFMRERKGTGTSAERQQEFVDWIAARAAA